MHLVYVTSNTIFSVLLRGMRHIYLVAQPFSNVIYDFKAS